MDNIWNKDRKEPSLDKETDKDRIARLEKEVQELMDIAEKTGCDDDSGLSVSEEITNRKTRVNKVKRGERKDRESNQVVFCVK